MNNLRYALSLGIALLIISALSEIDYSHFTFQNASLSLTKIAALLLAAYTLWSKRTTERLKDRKIVRNIRLLLTALLVYGFVRSSGDWISAVFLWRMLAMNLLCWA
ncbi:hypothetical protein WJR50_15475 [Catalinimonas sp. 4WD22]|uniref:hypothetical protein n=1 Tax=Catalinimonas locisalis TaxID=3133978 RepID=UPI003100ED3B